MKRQVLVNSDLKLSLTQIKEAMDYVDDDYWLEVTLDDDYNYSIDPKSEYRSQKYNVIDLDDYEGLPFNSMSFSDYLESQSMSGYRLAKLTGITQSTISDLITGTSDIRNAKWETVQKICQALEITTEYLYEILKD